MSVPPEILRTLAVDRVTGEVVAALLASGLDPVLLKGPTSDGWPPDQQRPRNYRDTDLLVAPDDAALARSVLHRLGFRQELAPGEAPGAAHRAVNYRRGSDRANVDLHVALEGARATPAQQWSALTTETDVRMTGGSTVRTLAAPGRALVAALHAAQHGPAYVKALDDLRNALRSTEPTVWEQAHSLASELEATAAFGAGLRLVRAGRELAAQLELPERMPVETALRAGGSAPLALGLEELSQLEGWRARLRRVVRELFPTPGFMRYWWPRARRGRAWLAIAYVARPLWLAWRIGPAWRAWRRAGRAAGSDTSTD